MSNTTLKIVIAGLVAGAVMFFIFFGGFGAKISPPEAAPIEEAAPSTPQEETLSSATVSTSPDASVGIPTLRRDSGDAADTLPKCPRREFTIRILSIERAEPANLTVLVGDTVTFVNEDNELRWPGADPHPTHSSLPLFDALGGISTGQSYSHTLKQAGRYGWHDHIPDNPPTVGYITVLECEM